MSKEKTWHKCLGHDMEDWHWESAPAGTDGFYPTMGKARDAWILASDSKIHYVNDPRYREAETETEVKPAKGTKGFILETGAGFHNRKVFRVYHDGEFTDYDISHQDLEVEILSDCAVFRDGINVLDYSDQVLGRTATKEQEKQ